MAEKNNKTRRKGVTLVELVITALAAVILILGISGILALGHRNYRTMFRRTTSEVVRNGYEARIKFDQIVRKSSIRREHLLNGNNELYVFYYSDPQNPAIVEPDMYARFYISTNGSEQELMLARGQYNWASDVPSPAASTQVIAHNIVLPAAGIFSVNANAIQMKMVLDNETGSDNPLETVKMTVTSTAIRHNK